MCQHKTNQRRMYQEAVKNKKAYKPYRFVCIFLFLSCIPIKKYGVVSLGTGFDRLTACSWCGAKWVNNRVLATVPPQRAGQGKASMSVLYSSGTRCLTWFIHECTLWN